MKNGAFWLALVVGPLFLFGGPCVVIQTSSLEEARRDSTKVQLSALRSLLRQYRAIAGRFPTTAEGLDALARSAGRNGEPLLTWIPKDPWDHPFQYRAVVGSSSIGFELRSAGRDGKLGTSDDAVITEQTRP